MYAKNRTRGDFVSQFVRDQQEVREREREPRVSSLVRVVCAVTAKFWGGVKLGAWTDGGRIEKVSLSPG